MKLVSSAQNVHQQLHHCVHGCEGIREEDETNDDGELLVEAEGLVEGAVIDEDGEEGKDVEYVELANVRLVLLAGLGTTDL